MRLWAAGDPHVQRAHTMTLASRRLPCLSSCFVSICQRALRPAQRQPQVIRTERSDAITSFISTFLQSDKVKKSNKKETTKI